MKIFMKLHKNYQNIAFVALYCKLLVLQPKKLLVLFQVSEIWVCSRYFLLKYTKGNWPNFKRFATLVPPSSAFKYRLFLYFELLKRLLLFFSHKHLNIEGNAYCFDFLFYKEYVL